MRYTVVDSFCNCITGKGGRWAEGATVSVILDVDNNRAFLQNVNSVYTKAEVLSDATKALYGFGEGGVPDDVMSLLSKATLHTKVPLREKLGTLGELAVGTVIRLNENGAPAEFYVAKHNYESGLNGTGRTLLVRKWLHDSRAWDDATSEYASSDIDAWLNGTYKKLLDEDVQTAMSSTSFYYYPTAGGSISTLSRSVFLLSATELGGNDTTKFQVEGSALPIASELTSARAQSTGNYGMQWTRSPRAKSGDNYVIAANGAVFNLYVCTQTSYYPRPAFTLPDDFGGAWYMDSDGTAYNEPLYGGDITDVSGNYLLSWPSARIATGAYIGTGTYGATNLNSLAFDFPPKFVWVYREGSVYLTVGTASGSHRANYFMWAPGITNVNLAFTNGTYYVNGIVVSQSGNTISWYSTTDADLQCNTSGFTYRYIVIG